MDTIFLVCAAFGGTILVVQTVLLFVGIGGDELDADLPDDVDVDAGDAGGNSFFKVLSLKAIVAFTTFFGLGGMLARSLDAGVFESALAGAVAGCVAVWAVLEMMKAISKLNSSGNYDLHDALGSQGRVALRVPGENTGSGRVTVDFKGRRVECEAVTEGPELPTGAPIRVTSVRGPRTVAVIAL